MKKKRALAAVLVAVAGLMAVGGTPANATAAATLPTNQRLFAIDCESFGPQLWSLDATNGEATTVGTSSTADCAGGAQVNPVDGKAYFIYYGATSSLDTVDTTTGVATRGPDFNGATVSPWQLVITKTGTAFVQVLNKLYTLDLATGTTAVVGTNLGVSPNAMAYNPLNDTIYAWAWDSGTSTLLAYTVSTTTGSATADPAHDVVMAPYSVTGCGDPQQLDSLSAAAFDANGNPWFINGGCLSDLIVHNFATGAASFQGLVADEARTLYTNPTGEFFTTTLFITTDPVDPVNPVDPVDPEAAALPDTGANASVIGTSSAIAAGLLAAGALALVMVRRRLARE